MAGELLELTMRGNEKLLARVVKRFEVVIANSFQEDKSRMTRAEVKRRFEILEKAYRELKNEPFFWSTVRILDALPRALRAKLDGTPWKPEEERTIWTPPK